MRLRRPAPELDDLFDEDGAPTEAATDTAADDVHRTGEGADDVLDSDDVAPDAPGAALRERLPRRRRAAAEPDGVPRSGVPRALIVSSVAAIIAIAALAVSISGRSSSLEPLAAAPVTVAAPPPEAAVPPSVTAPQPSARERRRARARTHAQHRAAERNRRPVRRARRPSRPSRSVGPSAPELRTPPAPAVAAFASPPVASAWRSVSPGPSTGGETSSNREFSIER